MDAAQLDAVASAFEKNRQKLYGYATYLARRLRLPDGGADDLLSEVALVACEKALRAPKTLPEAEELWLPWLLRIALYKALNLGRKNLHEEQAKDADAVLLEHRLFTRIEEDAIHARLDIQAFLDTLDLDNRHLFQELLRSGKTSAEIEKESGVAAATVRKQKQRLLEQLKNYLQRR